MSIGLQHLAFAGSAGPAAIFKSTGLRPCSFSLFFFDKPVEIAVGHGESGTRLLSLAVTRATRIERRQKGRNMKKGKRKEARKEGRKEKKSELKKARGTKKNKHTSKQARRFASKQVGLQASK